MSESRARCAALRTRLADAGLDALLVSSLPSIRYLTGFTGSYGFFLLTARGATLFTDPRYTVQAAQQCDACAVRITKGRLMLDTVARHAKVARLGFDARQMSYSTYAYLRKALPGATKLTPADGLVEQQRMVKSASEIALIRQAVLTNSRAFDAALRTLRPGQRENELAAELDYQMRQHGAEGVAFETIVASGARAALPHARPTTAPIGRNQLLLIDMGACQEGYASDMTRTVGVGRPAQRLRTAYEAVLESQLAAVDAVRPGVTFAKVDQVARNVLRKHGLHKAFIHSLGHGLGLEIHEAPRLARTEKGVLAPGMVITIEPGVYLADDYGVRIEDTVLVTGTGHEVLTPTPKSYQIF